MRPTKYMYPTLTLVRVDLLDKLLEAILFQNLIRVEDVAGVFEPVLLLQDLWMR